MKRVRIVLGMILLAMTLAACDSGGSPTATPIVPATATPAAPATPVTPGSTSTPDTMGTPGTSGTPSTGGTSFELDTSGTIAGIHHLLKIDESRNSSFTDGRNPMTSGSVTEEQYAALVAQVTKADFFNLKPDYDFGGIADDRYYTVTIKQGTQSKSVTVAEIGGKDLTPQALTDLIAQLVDVENGLKPATNN